MSFWKWLTGLFKRPKGPPPAGAGGPTPHAAPVPVHAPAPGAGRPAVSAANPQSSGSRNLRPEDDDQGRTIRIFISSTFKDMIEDRNELMSHAWPELRRFCQERQVELVEVDMRWGITEEQSTRKATLKLCLDEIRRCRPFFIGLLGERYGWVPNDEAFTADLRQEEPWLGMLKDRSVTELEILHGVLNNPDMAGRAFFYFRDPAHAASRGPDFQSDSPAAAEAQTALKDRIREVCGEKHIPLVETYPNPHSLPALVLAHLKAAIEAQYPLAAVPDALTREARDHEAFARSRRRTWIGRPEYLTALDRHAQSDGPPLVILGDSGGGKSALLANWVALWRKAHSDDFILQHYIGGTADSADHARLVWRIIAEIKRWTEDPEELPRSREDALKDFPLWLVKAQLRAQRLGVRFILILDALNQLQDQDNAPLLNWLPAHPFSGPLRLIVSTLPGPSLQVLQQRGWPTHMVEPLELDEKKKLIADYLKRFSKELDKHHIARLAGAPATANPLYLKILLDELRITGTHDRLDEKLKKYLAAKDTPSLLRSILARYQHDYEVDRPGLVAEALGVIRAARRGLMESELLRLLRPPDQDQLPPALWAPLRAALDDALVDRAGVLNFAHDYLRQAVDSQFLPGDHQVRVLRLRLSAFFESEPVSARSCDELPWLLKEAGERDRLRACLLGMDSFMEIYQRDKLELMRYWIWLGQERTMGEAYLSSFKEWEISPGIEEVRISIIAGGLGSFLLAAAIHAHAEPVMHRALAIAESSFGKEHPNVAIALNNLAMLFRATNRLPEAELLYRRALAINERYFGSEHPNVADGINYLAMLLKATNRLVEAEPLYRRALTIYEAYFGKDHHHVASALNNLAQLLKATNRLAEAEPLLRRALAIDEASFGREHPDFALKLNNLALLLQATNRLAEAEPLMRRAMAIDEASFGKEHPSVARDLNNLAQLLQATNRLAEAEPLMTRVVEVLTASHGENDPFVAVALSNLASLLQATDRLSEAEPLMRRALAIDEASFDKEHPQVAVSLNNLATLLHATNRLAEAKPLMSRALAIFENSLGKEHPHSCLVRNNLKII